MQRIRRIALLPMIALLLLAGCASRPEPSGGASYAPLVTDLRVAPFEAAKVVEEQGVRLYVGETFFGTSLIDLLHREVTLKSPRLPRQHLLEVTDLEVSIFVSGGNLLVDPSRELRASNRYRPTPGQLVLDELGPEAAQTVRVRIGYLLNGQAQQETLTGTARTADVRIRAAQLYRDAIGQLVGRLASNG